MRRVLFWALIGLIVASCAYAVDIKSLIGAQDINWGTGTYTRKTSTGSTITMNKVDSAAIPLKSVSGFYLDDLFDGAWGLTIYPSTITGSGAGTITGFSSITGTQGIFTTDNVTTLNVTTANITTSITTTDNITTANITNGNISNLAVTDATPAFVDNSIDGVDLTDNTVLRSKVRFIGALVTYAAAAQSIDNASLTLAAWPAESYDTSSIHSTVSNSDRLTVPTGASVVRLSADIVFVSDANGGRTVQVLKNGGITYDGYTRESVPASSTGATHINLISPPLSVTAGDYFSVRVYQDSGSALELELKSWFAMEVIQ